MKPREAVENRPDPSSRQWTIPSRLVLLVTPMAAVVVVLGMFGVWTLITADETAGFSWMDALAIAIGVVVVLVAAGTLLAAHLIGRSMTERIGEVTTAARRVADRDLVELLDALRNPEPDLASIAPMTLPTADEDEIGDLARSFQGLHSSLIEVGARQMEALRAGVSSIFVTLARRNSSLVDRQLALLDQLEAREEDPEVLAGFYQLDHLATRMRRNAESLLVLAGSESPRVWAKPTDMSDVVRAAISEIDEYQRIEVVALEPARLSGGAVSDVSHLIAELLENAIQFSPPSEMIRVTGLFGLDGYQLSVSDRGVGMSEARVAEMNRILHRPPALGLSVEPTLGMYVIAKLADRHGLAVELIRAVPGVTARITVPRDHLEAPPPPESRPWDDDHHARLAAARAEAASAVVYDDPETLQYVHGRALQTAATIDQVVDLTDPVYNGDDPVEPRGDLPVRTPGLAFNDEDDPERSVTPGEGASTIRAALSAYDQGRRSAADAEETEPARFWKEPPSEDDR